MEDYQDSQYNDEQYEQDFEPEDESSEPTTLISLENYDPYNLHCRIRSPYSLQVCKEEGVLLSELYVKSKEEIQVHA